MTDELCDDYDDTDCANCGGEGFVYGCSWDWQCDTYDEGEGTCLCTRRCDWCNPAKPTKQDEELRALLGEMLSRSPHSASENTERSAAICGLPGKFRTGEKA